MTTDQAKALGSEIPEGSTLSSAWLGKHIREESYMWGPWTHCLLMNIEMSQSGMTGHGDNEKV